MIVQSSDNIIFNVNDNIVKFIPLLNEINDINVNNETVKLLHITGSTFKLVLEWSTAFLNKQTSINVSLFNLTSWERVFFNNITKEGLKNLTLASLFFGIDQLLETVCYVIAVIIKGKILTNNINELFDIHTINIEDSNNDDNMS